MERRLKLGSEAGLRNLAHGQVWAAFPSHRASLAQEPKIKKHDLHFGDEIVAMDKAIPVSHQQLPSLIM